MKFFDLHCDTIGECYQVNEPLNENSLHISLKKAACLSGWCQTFAIWMPDELRGQAAIEYFDKVYAYFLNQIQENEESISFCKSAEDIRNAAEHKKCAAILSVEGGGAAAGSLDRIKYMYDCGVRMMTLTWNGSCELGNGSGVQDAKGLTDFGKETVKLMEQIGMIVDVSHLSDKGFYDVAKITSKPFVATHSNSRAVWNHVRNLTDEEFDIINFRGGLVGINLFKDFLCESCDTNGAETVLKHIGHFLERGGENVLSFGSDFDGAQMPDDLDGIEKIPVLYEYLLKNGLEHRTADKIFYQNAYDFFQRVLQ